VPNPLNPGQVAGAAQTAVKTVVGVVPGAKEAAGILDAVIASRRWLSDRHNWVRVAWVSAGFALVVGGAFVLARRPVNAAINSVVAPVTGAVTKGAVK